MAPARFWHFSVMGRRFVVALSLLSADTEGIAKGVLSYQRPHWHSRKKCSVMREFSILIRQAPDIAGQWLAHCLNWDVLSHGSSPREAAAAIAEALVVTIEEDSHLGLDPSDRRPAPATYWEPFINAMKHGSPLNTDRLDSVSAGPGTLIAGTLYMVPLSKGVSPLPEVEQMPPPFVIRAIEDRAAV